MEAKHFVSIVIRVFSIVIFLYAVNSGANVVPLIDDPAYKSIAYFQVASIITMLLVAVFLWFFPLIVASGLLPRSSEPSNSPSKLEPIDFQVVCFTSITFYLLFNVLSDVIYWGSYLLFFGESQFDSQDIIAHDKASIITTVIELIVLVPLLMNIKGFILVLNKLRYGG
ncbi:hypothetical protein EZV61_19145 [Corallincola luteus]|uniref:Uncharacterized protein n=1 Tax=Corallincola luteus TaxID=1775177 RepID=A0ABY2AIN5_9GAMM|nr:hypothetical protein [Corallincola luteus]TCI01127.1 hypothetical protein EZV61_19145 [Corallincola luteus]